MSARIFAAAATLWLFAAAPASAAAPAQYIEGTALRLPERSVAYHERHRIEGERHRIDYRAPDGNAIAQQTLDYACSDSAPAFEQRDLRSGRRIGARWEDGTYVLLRADQTRREEADPRLVASSGFDRFVRTHWERLAAGEELRVRFALPARLQVLALRITREYDAAPEDPVRYWFEIVPQRAWLRLFVDPILLGYDAERRLRVYRGISNLSDADGSALEVEIRYEYPAAPPTSGAANEPAVRMPRSSVNSRCPGPVA